MKLEFEVTEEDLAAIGHVVVDPVQWVQNAFLTAGVGSIIVKIAKYRKEYESAKASLGSNYKNRAQRELESMEGQ